MTRRKLQALAGTFVLLLSGFAVAGGWPFVEGGGLTPTTADATYLKLDASNDPMTGFLSVETATGPSTTTECTTGISFNGNEDATPGTDGAHMCGNSSGDLYLYPVAGRTLTLGSLVNGGHNLAFTAPSTGEIRFRDSVGTVWTVDPTAETWTSEVADGSDAWVFDVTNAHTSGDLFSIEEAGTQVVRVDAAGDFYTGSVIPRITNNRALGSTIGRYLNLYLAGQNYTGVSDTWTENSADGAQGFLYNVTTAHATGNLWTLQEALVDVMHIGPAGFLFPGGNGTQDLGKNGNAWRRVYVNNIAAQGTAAIDFEDNVTIGQGLSIASSSADGQSGLVLDVTTAHATGNLYEFKEAGTVIASVEADNDWDFQSNALTGVTSVGINGSEVSTIYVDALANSGNFITAGDAVFSTVTLDLSGGGKHIGAAPSARPTCNSTNEGYMIYSNDTDDTKHGSLCICGQLSGTVDVTMGWNVILGDSGCP